VAERPKFQKPAAANVTSSPEELFHSLSVGRAKTHGYLRGPQQDALREYAEHHTCSDIAFELPTGSGKTLVALLVGEWLAPEELQRRLRALQLKLRRCLGLVDVHDLWSDFLHGS